VLYIHGTPPFKSLRVQAWIAEINIKLLSRKSPYFHFIFPILFISTPVQVSFNTAWLSGFTDGEGTFNITINSEGQPEGLNFIRFQLVQKDARYLIEAIQVLFNGQGTVDNPSPDATDT